MFCSSRRSEPRSTLYLAALEPGRPWRPCTGPSRRRQSSKRKVARSLERSTCTQCRTSPSRVSRACIARLVQRRDQLNEHAVALHEERAPWQISFFDAQAELLGLPDSVTNRHSLSRSGARASSARTQLAHAAEDLEGLRRPRGPPTAPLRIAVGAGRRSVSEAEAHQCRVVVDDAQTSALPHGTCANLDRASDRDGTAAARARSTGGASDSTCGDVSSTST